MTKLTEYSQYFYQKSITIKQIAVIK